MIWGRLVYLWLRMLRGRRKTAPKVYGHNPAFDPSLLRMQAYAAYDVETTGMMYDIIPEYKPARKYKENR